MGVVDGTLRTVGQTVGRAATATTAVAGAVGGAAVSGVVGGVTGTVTGVQRGVNAGSHSMPAAALTLGALGVSGLVEWPLLLAVGGGALLLRQLNRQPATATKAPADTGHAETAPVKLTSVRSTRSNPPRSTKTKPATAPRSRGGQSGSKRSSRV